MLSRKKFIKKSALILGTTIITPACYSQNTEQKKNIYSYDEIEEFVFAAHSDFDKTKKIVTNKPTIINATNQFIKGDFETALGGAAHMGRKDIADMLLARGARQDIFTMTFFGEDDFIKQMINKSPELINAPGPHGFTLLHHARIGKHKKMEEWFLSKGLTENMFKDVFGEN
ncbi:hypothetical protein [Winogradskyella sp.]|uniref:hypothetical protein n=1 Tax=Winogradskyella sp. TaxID=1883156 RepID=UPI003BA946DB